MIVGSFALFIVIAITGAALQKTYTNHLNQIESMCQSVNHCVHLHQSQIGISSWGGLTLRVGIIGSAVALVMFCMSLTLPKKSN